ncbi:ornithine carbamoyltransferase [Desulfurispira natronophila]|uniref:Ornithine carbamoyltransferase n=1 Tax=Desulfurispira natronophila TaxID=682562 RepID=A0A7W7Y657_9BACT|nr:ornithine carbamoyltransferase [Desulfurispira natronophila]MBB5022778.1 ornithine carbamoyltransferase [Desulfurispira natronophila]
MKHFIALRDYSQQELQLILEQAFLLKSQQKQKTRHRLLEGKTLAMIFEKSSTRTRVSFETGIFQLGGVGLFLSSQDLQMGRGEPIKDTAVVLSRYVDGIMIRTFAHETVEELAMHSSVPVINGLSDLLHPCQIMADVMTMMEHSPKPINEIEVAYVGDGNNVANSLVYGAASLGYHVRIATPPGYEIPERIAEHARQIATSTNARITFTHDPAEAVQGCDFVYTDTWASMGQEEEKQQRLDDFRGFTVDEKLMSLGSPDCKFLHCLPAYRDMEVSADVCDGPRSIIYDQAENRLHAQKAIMAYLMT